MKRIKKDKIVNENNVESMEHNPYLGNEPYVFVSYSRKDSEIVYPILKQLQKAKYRIWYDINGIKSGETFPKELENKIEHAYAVVLFVSKESAKSKYCGMEILCATKYRDKIYPVRLDDAPYPITFQMYLEKFQDIRFPPEEWEKIADKLAKDLPKETMDRLVKEPDEEFEGKYQIKKCEDNGTSIIVDDDVVRICKEAFKNCGQLETIELQDGLKIIGNESFRSCRSLKKMDIPDSTIRIGESAFRDCIKMESLTIKNSAVKIEERAFENCASLTSISLPDEMTEIYGGVFNSCRRLKTVTLPKNLTILGENAFSDCESLEEIDMPSMVTKIDDLVFNGCSNLKKVVLNNELKKIGKGAFKNCEALEEIEIPALVSHIGDAPFRGCKKLKSIKVNAKSKTFKSVACDESGENHVLFNKNKSVIITYPAASCEEGVKYDIPDSVTVVSNWTFCDCKNLKEIVIPDSVSEIGEGAFCNCTGIERLEIPDTVTKIDDCAFRGCFNLKEVIIPPSVDELGWGLFDGCEDKVEVTCQENSEIYKYCTRHGIATNLCDFD